MLPLRPDSEDAGVLHLLCLGAHADDIEIGCGGTLLEWADGPHELYVHWVVFSAPGIRESEARDSATRLLPDVRSLEVTVLEHRDGYFPEEWGGVKEALQAVTERVSPDLIFTHRGSDAHQDHRIVSELTRQLFRDHLVLEYEIPKYDGDLGRPNLFVSLAEATARRKAQHLLEAFPSQREKSWFTADTFLALSRLRGIECAAPSGHAEAFHARKILLQA